MRITVVIEIQRGSWVKLGVLITAHRRCSCREIRVLLEQIVGDVHRCLVEPLRAHCAVVSEDGVDRLRRSDVLLEARLDQLEVGAEAEGDEPRHGGAHAEQAGGVVGGGYHLLAADGHGDVFERRVVELFDGGVEGVHVEVQPDAGEVPGCLELVFERRNAGNRFVVIGKEGF